MNQDMMKLKNLEGVSEYAMVNTSEFFAEGFSAYTSGETTPFAKGFGEFLRRWIK